MADSPGSDINPALADEIEDAIMFGRAGDLEAIIQNISDDKNFPDDLRQGLESLHYFRAHYGQAPMPEPERKKATLMEQSWAMELLNKMRARVGTMIKRA